MASYLEAYGASEQKRARLLSLIKKSSIVVLSALVIGLILFGVFKNYSEEQLVKAFVARLQAQDYQGAYAMWGCDSSHPCPNYSFNQFLDDWGPKSPHAGQADVHLGVSQSCGSGVVIQLDYKGSPEPVALWVERTTNTISFSPWPECPGRHLHIGAWLRSIFSK